MSLEAKIGERKGVCTILIPLNLKKTLEAEKFRIAMATGITPAYHDVIREWYEDHVIVEEQRAEAKKLSSREQDAA